MAMPCATCAHPNRTDLDSALASNVSLAECSRRFGVGVKALGRHRRNHLSPAIAAVHEGRRVRPLLDRATKLVDEAEAVLATAKAEGRASLALSAIREVRESLRLLGMVSGELKGEGDARSAAPDGVGRGGPAALTRRCLALTSRPLGCPRPSCGRHRFWRGGRVVKGSRL